MTLERERGLIYCYCLNHKSLYLLLFLFRLLCNRFILLNSIILKFSYFYSQFNSLTFMYVCESGLFESLPGRYEYVSSIIISLFIFKLFIYLGHSNYYFIWIDLFILTSFTLLFYIHPITVYI